MEGFLAKISHQQRSDLSKLYGILWEDDDESISCRYCSVPFTLTNRKHHCRTCGGIYCNSCCFHRGEMKRCKYCYSGLSPSFSLLESYRSISQYSGITNGAAGSNGRNGDRIFIRLPQPQLTFGSLYDKNYVRPIGEIAHKSGYFQLTNRSETKCCAVKILSDGCNIYHEIFRPPYIPLPPKESVYANILSLKVLYLLVLFDNPYPTTEGMEITYDSLRGEELSSCTAPKFFQKFSIYKAQCRGKNVLLKFTEQNKVELRDGQGRRIKYKAVNLITDLMKTVTSSSPSSSSAMNTGTKDGSDSLLAAATLDYETNIEDIEEMLSP